MVDKMEGIERLLEIMGSTNPAEILDDKLLATVGCDIIEQFGEDLDSMAEWLGLVEEGRDLMKQDFNARSTPWDGAANFKSPLIMNAVLTFGDTSSQELLRKSDVVKSMILGPDPEGQREAQGFRVSTYMNYQVNVEMTDWRTAHDKLLYTLPSTGCMFKKTFFDTTLGHNVSDVVFYPNFAINQANTTMEGALAFTQILQFTENEVIEKMRSGQWIDVELSPSEKKDEGKSEEISKKTIVEDSNLTEQPEENEDRFLEQHGWYDLDEDGYKEPYVITIHENSRKIVKIAPRFLAPQVKVKVKGAKEGEFFNLHVVQEMQKEPIEEGQEAIKVEQVVSIVPISLITKFDFLPDPTGAFLGIGYPHLLAGVTQAINTTTNHLLDAGTLANLPGGYLAKGVRKKLGEDRFKPGEWKGTNVPARDFANAFFPLPYGEPSQTLFALNEKMQQEGERTANSADFSKVLANNAPATTTLALLQKETQSTTSIIRRIYLAMSEEFKKMAILNQNFVDPKKYQKVLANEEADFKSDFDAASLNLVPISNPEMSTRIERIKSAEVQMNFLPQIAEAGGSTQVVIKGFLEALGVENIDKIFPEPQQDQIDRQTEEQKRQNDTMEFQNGLFDRELAVREQDLQRKVAETQSDIAETRAKILKIKADAALSGEQAETESMKNNLAIYTTELGVLAGLLGKLEGGKNENSGAAT